MNALRKDLKPGEYPYVNGYNRDLYNKQLRSLQIELLKLQSWIQKKGKKLVIIFEGRDAAGKGGTIQRFTEHLNPRGARIAALPKPTATEERLSLIHISRSLQITAALALFPTDLTSAGFQHFLNLYH